MVQRTEQIRRTKTWEVETPTKEEAEDWVYDNELPPQKTSEKLIDSDTDTFAV